MLQLYNRKETYRSEETAARKDVSTVRNKLSAAADGAMGAAPQKARLQVSASTVFWMFVFGSFSGFIVETVSGLVKYGVFENRSGLLLVPLNLIYGAGALALYFGFFKITKHNVFLIFIVGMFSGTAVEFAASWFQQMVFGSVSWDYSDLSFNIGGRVSLLFSTYWGILAVAWVKGLQPLFENILSRINKRAEKKLIMLILTFLIFSAILSAVSVMRWEMRLDGIPASNSFFMLIDSLFPDSLMELFYPNMTHL